MTTSSGFVNGPSKCRPRKSIRCGNVKWLGSTLTFWLNAVIYSQVYEANKDNYAVVVNTLDQPIVARCIRIHPIAWHGHISFRFEMYGCFSGELYWPGKLEKNSQTGVKQEKRCTHFHSRPSPFLFLPLPLPSSPYYLEGCPIQWHNEIHDSLW